MKKFTRNIIISLLSKILLIISGIIAQYFILNSFGSEINGLTSTITQFLTYFTLLEAGLGLASIQALYAPLYEKDSDVINSILSATDKQYKKTGAIFLVLLISLSFILPFITDSSLGYWQIVIITLLMGIPNVLLYFFIGKVNTLLYADRNIHIITILDAVLGIIFAVIKVIIINLGGSIEFVLISQIVSPIIRIVILFIYVKKKYNYIDFKAKPDNSYISKRWSALVHQFVGMITNHTDVILLGVFSTLSMVSVYSVYNYIYSNISNVLQTSLLSAPQASFGKWYQSDSKEKFNTRFAAFELFIFFVVFVIVCTAIVMTLPFVKLYTINVIDVEYLNYTLALLFGISILFSTIRIPYVMMINITGTFKETRLGAILEAVINLAVSIPLLFVMGIEGLLIGTCVALMYRSIDVIVYCYKKLINKSILSIIKLLLIYLSFAVVYIVVFNYCITLDINNWFSWLLIALCVFLSSCIWFLLPIIIFYPKYLINGFKYLKKYIKKIKFKR